MKSRRRLDERRAGIEGETAREPLFLVRQYRRFEDDLDGGSPDCPNNGLDVGGHQRRAAAPQRAEVLHHVDLAGAVRHGERSRACLDVAAIDAVRQWEYAPTILNGAPVPVIMTVTVNFAIKPSTQPAPAPAK